MTSDEISQEIDMVIGSNEHEETSEDVADTTFTPRRPPGKQSSVNIVRQVPGPSAAARQNLAKEVDFWEAKNLSKKTAKQCLCMIYNKIVKKERKKRR